MKQKKLKGLKIKDKIRTDLFPPLASSLNTLGISWERLGRSKLRNSTLIAQGQKIAGTIHPEKTEKPLNVYFLTMLGGHTHNLSLEIIMAWGLKQKGHNVCFILDDQSLPISEDTLVGQEQRWKEVSARSYNYGRKYIMACGLKVLGISEIVDINQERNIDEFSSIIEAGLLKHFRVGILTDDLPLIKEKKKLLEESARISALTGDFLVKLNPDRVIMSHGIYPTWGPAFIILDKAGIPIVTYGRGKKAETQKFNWNMTSDWWDVSKEWERVKHLPLNEEQNKKISHYLKTRIAHSEDVMVYNFGALEEREKTLQRFNLNPDKLTYTLFTNVLWDAASAQREIAFRNPVEWVFETIEWFASQPEKQLIVKIHPAEVVIGTKQPFAGLIRERIPNLPFNVRLIEPQEKVNSWSIYKVTDLGIVHTTTAGMELPLVGVPCIVVSKTHFRGRGFTVDINSKESYFNYLKNFSKEAVDQNVLKVLSERYAYLLFERYQIPFKVFNERGSLNTLSLKFENISDIFNEKNVSMIIEDIINQNEFLVHE
ncbi:MAG TPA: hypothetical protein VFI29_16450 [Hanamia sp.]|nr:hypothetical protein [Hanamia sp.]